MTARSRRRSRASASCRNTAARAWRPCLPRWRRCRRPVPIRSASRRPRASPRICCRPTRSSPVPASCHPTPRRWRAMTIPVGGFSVTSFSPYAPALPAVKRPNPLDGFTPISDAQLVEPRGAGLAHLAAQLRRAGLQPAHADHGEERRRPARRVELDAAARIVRVHAARARRRACSCRAPTTGCRRSTRAPATCCGSTSAACPKASPAASSAGWRCTATVSTWARPTCTSSRSTRRPARWCGSRPSATRRCASRSAAARSSPGAR